MSIDMVLDQYDVKDSIKSLIHFLYRQSPEPCDAKGYEALVEHMMSHCDVTMLNTDMACFYSALMCLTMDHPRNGVMNLIRCMEHVRSTGFKSKISHLLAYALMSCEEIEDRLERAQIIHRRMQDDHGIITGEDDFLFTALLAKSKEDVDSLALRMESLYEWLHGQGFHKGNDLQALMESLVLLRLEPKQLEEGLVSCKQGFEQRFAIKLRHYEIGLYGFLLRLPIEYDRFFETYAYMDWKKLHKEGSLSFMTQFLQVLKGYLESALPGTGLDLSMKEALLLVLNAIFYRERLL